MNRSACLAGVLLIAAIPVRAEFEASLDLRLVSSDGRNSFLDGGFGKLRYDNDDDGLQLGRARLAWRSGIGGNWHASVDASAWHLEDDPVVDLTEAWLEWRPVPRSAWRSNLKIGAFYAPISMEHRAPGWSNPYTLSSSALNTWVGEELRTIGVGYELEHLGQLNGSAFDFGVNAAVFGWNDPAGVVVAFRGFALHDRQTTLFGTIGTYAFGGPTQRVVFAEIDNRAGWHAGAWVKHDSGLELRALHYDNRGDPSVYEAGISDYAWRTRFDSAGLRYDGPRGTSVIVQWMGGNTAAGAGSANYWDFEAAFALLAQQLGPVRLAVRYDDFHTSQERSARASPLGVERGNAFTLGATWTLSEHVELVAEWLDVDSYYSKRVVIGELPDADEHLLQMAIRLSL